MRPKIKNDPSRWPHVLFGLVWLASWFWLSPRFIHNDLSITAWISHFAPGHWNVYEAVRGTDPTKAWLATYPPLAYWTVGIWMQVGRTLLGLFTHPEWNALVQKAHWAAMPVLPTSEWLWLKLLALPFHLAIAWFGARLLPGQRPEGLQARLLAQPVLLFISLLMGQIDVMATAMTVIAVWAFARGPRHAYVATGFGALALGTLLKSYPVLLAAGFAVLFFFHPRWRRTLPMGVLVFLFITVAGVLPIWGPDFQKSFFTSVRTSHYLHAGLDTHYVPFKVILAVILVACLLLGATRPVRWGETWGRSCRTAWNAWAPPEKFPGLFILVPCVVLSLVLFDRFWMPQYIVWIAPWVVLLQMWHSGAPVKPTALSTALSRLPLFLSATFLLAAPANFPQNVDSNMYLHWKQGPTVGGDLWTLSGPLFFLHTFCYWVLPLCVLGVFFRRRGPQPARETTPLLATWGYFLLFVMGVDIFMLYPLLRP